MTNVLINGDSREMCGCSRVTVHARAHAPVMLALAAACPTSR